jgi:UPF0755 protein
MTVRNGGGPRSGRGRGTGADSTDKVPVLDKGWDDYKPADPVPTVPGKKVKKGKTQSLDMRRDYRSNRSAGIAGILRFALFAVVLGGLVVGGLYYFARPAIVKGIVDFSAENPTALRVPFIADLVRGELHTSLTVPVDANSDSSVPFVVSPGDTPQEIADDLYKAGLIRESRAFVFESIETGLSSQFQAGRHVLKKSMTLDQIMNILTTVPVAPPFVRLTFREGLRIEQMVALIEYKEANPDDPTAPLTLDVGQFYQLAESPPSYLLADYPWLKLPAGASLEGFLFPATYNVAPDITAEQLIRQMLTAFTDNAPTGMLALPPAQIYKDVQIASLVEPEVKLDADRPLVAGVYVNRLDPKKWPTLLLNSNPSMSYANDSVWLDANPIADWVNYTFWVEPTGTIPFGQMVFPTKIAPYNTYHHGGLPPTPIDSPGAASLAAAMTPNTATGYYFFLAKKDGSIVYAKTQAEQTANVKKYLGK